MSEATRRRPDEVGARLESGKDALLVCAYADEAKFRGARLEGAISLGTLNAKLPSLSKGAEIIFYCG
jgi:hypothetical protein